MRFKITENLKSGKRYYYIDGKRVSLDKFEVKEIICQRAGMSYNSSLLKTNNDFSYSYFSYN